MTTEEKIKVMQAYKNGKQIQSFDEHDEKWITIENPSWNFGFNEYRIKPEEPKYRAYKDTNEMIEDYKNRFIRGDVSINYMPLTWVRHKRTGVKYLIIIFYDYIVHLGDGICNIDALFDDYTYLDGSPIGKLVEE